MERPFSNRQAVTSQRYGTLTPHPDNDTIWEVRAAWQSKAMPVPLHGGIPLVFSVTDLEGKTDLPVGAENAIGKFLLVNREPYTETLYERMIRHMDNMGYDRDWYEKNKNVEQKYLFDIDAIKLLSIKNIESIWDYIEPYKNEISVCEHEKNPEIWRVESFCTCPWDEEHGVSIVLIGDEPLVFDYYD